MKSTGVIRRIDELGRIVIPKEIRRNLKIRDGENMEIFVDMDSIILKKYSKIEDSIDYAKRICKLLNGLTNNEIIITDRDHIIAAEGSNVENLVNELISQDMISVIDNRETYFSPKETSIEIIKESKMNGYFAIVPIITSADSIGLVIVYNKELILDDNKGLTKFIAGLMSAQVDIV